jgi:uncharacterized protein (TIGR02145 family)
LNYTKGLTYNAYVYEANGKQLTSLANGTSAIGSYWCPPQYWVSGSATAPVISGTEADCNTYGALYTWETAMMVDGKYADEAKTSTAWDESWVSGNYFTKGAPGLTAQADMNNARGAVTAKNGGRGICPMGWHVPTLREWAEMLDAVEGNTTFTISQDTSGTVGIKVGKLLKSAGTFVAAESDPGNGRWLSSGTPGVDSLGFSAVPAGSGFDNQEQFGFRGLRSPLWSSSIQSYQRSWYYEFIYDNNAVIRRSLNRKNSFTLRCIKD